MNRLFQLPRWVLILASLAGYAGLSRWFPLLPYYKQSPSPDIRSFAPSWPAGLAYAGLFCGLYALYWTAFRQIRSGRSPISARMVLLVGGLFCLPLLFTFPINANDVYRYFIRARITVVHGENPFLVAADEVSDEQYLPLAGEWAGETSPYGPIWELTAAALTRLSPNDLLGALLSFKALASLAHLGIAGLIYLSLSGQAPAIRTGRMLLWAWNPALLLIFAADGHNDSLMLLWLVAGWWQLRAGRPQVGLVLMLLGALTKPIGLLSWPIFLLATWRDRPGWAARLRMLLWTAGGTLAITALAFLPFGSPLALVQRLLGEAAADGGFSLLALIILEAREWGYAFDFRLLINLALASFATLSLYLLWQTWQGRSPLRGAADIFAGYVVQAFKFRIWYAVWPFPWLLMDRPEKSATGKTPWRLQAGLWFLLTSQLSVVIYGQIRSNLLGGSQLRAHFLGVPFTILLPFLLPWLVDSYSKRRSSMRQRER